MRVDLAYGRTGLTVELPAHTDIVSARFAPGLPDEAEAIREALRRPIASAPLAAKVKSGDKVAIAHSDITRATPNDRILPILLAELEAAGVQRRDITLINALGTHRRQTEADRKPGYDRWQQGFHVLASLVGSGRASGPRRGHAAAPETRTGLSHS